MKDKKREYNRLAAVLGFLLLAGASAYILFNWNSFPSELPSHYNSLGEVDRISPKSSLLIPLAVGWLLYIGMGLLIRFPKIWNTGGGSNEELQRRLYQIVKTMLGTTRMLIAGMFAYLAVHSTTGKNLPAGFLVVFVILVSVIMGVFIVKVKKECS